MKITFKLFAGLSKYLPKNAKRNEVEIVIDNGTCLQAVLDYHGVPLTQCHLVLVNGVYVAPSDRPTFVLSESDALAVWPPVAGG